MTVSAGGAGPPGARRLGRARRSRASGRTLGAAVVAVAVGLAVGDTVAPRPVARLALVGASAAGSLVGLVTLLAYLGVMMVADRKAMHGPARARRSRRRGSVGVRVVMLAGPQHRRHRHPRRSTSPPTCAPWATRSPSSPTRPRPTRFDLRRRAPVVARAGVRGCVGSLRGLRRLRGLVRGADVLHAHGHQAGLVAVARGAGHAAPRWSSASTTPSSAGGAATPGARPGPALVARRADLVTGASSDLVAEAARLGARDARLAAVPSPRVPGLLAPAPLADDASDARWPQSCCGENGIEPPTPDAPLVLTIARIAPQKDLDTLVEAAACAGRPTAPPRRVGGRRWR